jgi:dihydrodipicolinate reductase
LELSHRVHGRRVYAEGALVAAQFLAKVVAGGIPPRTYSMEDVLAESPGANFATS